MKTVVGNSSRAVAANATAIGDKNVQNIIALGSSLERHRPQQERRQVRVIAFLYARTGSRLYARTGSRPARARFIQMGDPGYRLGYRLPVMATARRMCLPFRPRGRAFAWRFGRARGLRTPGQRLADQLFDRRDRLVVRGRHDRNRGA